MKIDLTGKTAVIVGGSGGLGEAMALYAFRRRRVDRAGGAATRPSWTRSRATLKANGGQADFFTADVTEEADVARLAERGQRPASARRRS